MKHTAEEVLEKWKEHRHGNRLDTLKSPADIMRPKDRRAFLDCYDALAGLRPEAVREMREALELVQAKQPEALATIREHDFIFDDLDDRWQKLAFTLYNELVDVHSIAIAALAAAEQEE